MRRLLLFLILLPSSLAAVSDLYDFSVEKIPVAVSFAGKDSDGDAINDTISADLLIFEPGKYTVSFDLVDSDDRFVAHSEFSLSKSTLFGGTLSEDLAEVSSDEYSITVSIFEEGASQYDLALYRKEHVFKAEGFSEAAAQGVMWPSKKNASYEFVDEDDDSLYDQLIIRPSGYARVYDSNGDLIIATERGRIDLREFYPKRAEGPFRIVVEVDDDIYEATTGGQTYLDFEKPILPDLDAEVQEEKIIIHNRYAPVFDTFFLSIYEGDDLVKKEVVYHLGVEGESNQYELGYAASDQTLVIVDFENLIEESDEENNFAKYVSPDDHDEWSDSRAGSLTSYPGWKNSGSARLPASDVKSDAPEKEGSADQAEPPVEEQPDDLLLEKSGGEGAGSGFGFFDLFKKLFSKKDAALTGDAIRDAELSEPSKLLAFAIILAAALVGGYLYKLVFPKD